MITGSDLDFYNCFRFNQLGPRTSIGKTSMTGLTGVEDVDVHGPRVLIVLAGAVAAKREDAVTGDDGSVVDAAGTAVQRDRPPLHRYNMSPAGKEGT